MNIKFKGHESGLCRVYGTYNRKLYCLMEGYENPGFMGLFVCSKDGEPSHQIIESPYTFDKVSKLEIESTPSRCKETRKFGDNLIMELLKREQREWA